MVSLGLQLTTINEIKVNDDIVNVRFYREDYNLVVQGRSSTVGVNFITHEILYTLNQPCSTDPFSRLHIIEDTYVAFMSPSAQLFMYDISQSPPVQAMSKVFEIFKINVSSKYDPFNHTACAFIGNHIVMQLSEKDKPPQVILQKNPFLHKKLSGNDSLLLPFTSIGGFYIPIFMGGPVYNTGSFADIYTNAF